MQGWRAFDKRNTLEPFYLYVDKYYLQLNSWRKRFIKIMPPWYTCLFCGWLGNVQRFITCAEPLYDSFNPLFCDVFTAIVVCARSLLLWSIESHDVDLSVFCLLLYFWIKPRSHWNIPSEQLSSSTQEKDCTICPWKFPKNHPGIFGRMVSAHGLARAYRKAVFLARSSGNKSAR